MQQLTLQFEGFADEQQHIDVSATKQRTVNSLNAWLDESNVTATDLAGAKVSNLQVVQGALVTAFGFAVIFLATIIGG